VLKGDRVIVHAVGADTEAARRPPPKDTRFYEGVVHAAHDETLYLRFSSRFHASFVAGQRHYVQFTVRRTPALLQHAAVGPFARLPLPLLFPPRPEVAAAAALETSLPAPLHNRNLNELQLQAVRGALSAGDTAYVIFGVRSPRCANL
jgi:hypothetical protein